MRFSVLVPTFNRCALVRQTIESVLAQTHPDVELIVIDDGSTDGTAELLAGYGTRLIALRQANQGPEHARNLGATRATGDYLVFLDSDDLLHPHAIATYDQIAQTFAPALIIAALDEFTALPPAARPGPVSVWVASSYFAKPVGRFLSSSSLVLKRAVFDQGGGLRIYSTLQTWPADTFATVLRYGAVGPCVLIQQPTTVAYRLHQGNIMGNVAAMITCMRALVQEERAGLFPAGSTWARWACLGGMAASWVKRAWLVGRPDLAWRLLLPAAPMIAAALLRRIVRRPSAARSLP